MSTSSSHNEYYVSVVAAQRKFARSNPTLEQPMFLISANVFSYPENIFSNQETFSDMTKFCISRDLFSVPCYKLTSPKFAKETVSNLLAQMFVPFEFNQINWKQVHLDRRYSNKRLKDQDNLCMKISDFAGCMMQKWENSGRNILPFELSVVKIPKFQINNHLKLEISSKKSNLMVEELDIEEDTNRFGSPPSP